MAWNTTEELRVEVIESALNTLQTTLNNVASKRELQNLSALITTQIAALNSVDEDQYETQLQAITDAVETIQTALNNVASKREMKSILAVIRTEITSLTEQFENLESTTVILSPRSMTTAERDAMVATNGQLIYNTTAKRFQGYQNSAWINLDDGSAA